MSLDDFLPLNMNKADIARMRILKAVDRIMPFKSFDNLTVKDICNELGISRQTFYRYFKNKYEIVDWYLDVVVAPYVQEVGRTLSWVEGYLIMLEAVAEKASLFLSCLERDGLGSFRSMGSRKRVLYLKATVEDYCKAELTENLVFQIEHLANAEGRAILSWLKQGMPKHPQKLAEQLAQCVPGELYELLQLKE